MSEASTRRWPKTALAFGGPLAVTFASVLVVCTALVALAFSLPAAPVQESARRSLPTLEREGVYPRVFGIENCRLDNWTDATMLCIAAYEGDGGLKGALLDSYPSSSDPIAALDGYLDGDPVETPDYSRYWHGYQVALRPLLALGLDYSQIRIVNAAILIALLAGCCAALWARGMRRIVPALLATSLAISCPVFPLSLQYSGVFAISLAATALIALSPGPLGTPVGRCCFMLAVGMVTNYVDFLTFPLVTLGLPLVVFAASDDSRGGGGALLRTVLALCACWAAGYASMWVAKWVLASAVLGADLVSSALSQAGMRSGYELNPEAGTGLSSFTPPMLAAAIARRWASPVAWAPLAACAGAYALPCVARRSRSGAAGRVWALALVAVLPVAWYLALPNHSFQHAWFAYRTLAVSAFALLSLLALATDPDGAEA